MKLILFLLIFKASESLALKLKCKADEDPSKCIISDISNPLNEPLEFPSLLEQTKRVTVKNCSTSPVPLDLFVKYPSIKILDIMDCNLKQLGAGSYQIQFYLIFLTF